MSDGNRDDELVRAAFEDVKAEDAREYSSFDAVVSRSVAPRARWHTSPVLRLAAAGVVIASAMATYRGISGREHRLTVPSEVVALGSWRPATDVLLPKPSDLLRGQPALGKSILDLDTLTTGAFR